MAEEMLSYSPADMHAGQMSHLFPIPGVHERTSVRTGARGGGRVRTSSLRRLVKIGEARL